METKIIGIMGNIGAGKTTLCCALAKHYKIKKIEEIPENNPYLPLFYREPQIWGFHSKMWFLQYRFETYLNARGISPVVIDGTIWDDLAHALAVLHGNDLELYLDWFKIVEKLSHCDVVLYLMAPLDVLAKRMSKRNRTVELENQTYALDLLARLDKTYREVLNRMQVNVIKLDSAQNDFTDVNFDWKNITIPLRDIGEI